MLAVTKSDMLDDELKKAVMEHLPGAIQTVLISSITGYGVQDLLDILWKDLHE